MSITQVRVARWIIAGMAFAGIASQTGCSRVAGWFRGTTNQSGSAPVDLHQSPAAPNALGNARPPRPAAYDESLFGPELPRHVRTPDVNVFGELDGTERPVFGASGDAGFQQHTFLTEGADADVAVDPAGKWLAFTSTRHSDHPKIYLQKSDGLSVTQLTSDASDDAHPTFSPDGKKIAFASTRAGNWDIYLMDVDGKNVVQLTRSPGHELHPSFSPDGSQLVYSALGGRSSQWELWTIDLSNLTTRVIGTGFFPTWGPSRDSSQIAFQRARQRGSRWFSLWTLDLVDGEARNVTEVTVSSNAAIVAPSWSPDGKKLAFATIIEPARGTERPAEQDIWTINIDGTARKRLTDGVGTNLSPAWSTDGRVYFISNRGGNESVWSAPAMSADTKLAKKSTSHDEVGATDLHK